VLASLQRQGVEVQFSCRKGNCQTCLLKCTSGAIPHDSQLNLRPVLVNNGYFMPCVCRPFDDIEIADVARDDLYFSAVVHRKVMLSDNVCRLLIDAESLMDYRPGQFINLSRSADGLTRSYSIANRVDDYFIEIHVQRMINGVLSNWIIDELEEGSIIEVQGPNGVSVYQDGIIQESLIMISSGTGLAPHLGVIRDAIDHNHQGDIFVYHASASSAGAYLHQYMTQLSSTYANIHYFSCVQNGSIASDMYAVEPVKLLKSYHKNIDNCHIYLAGSPNMIESVRSDALFAAVPDNHIYMDSFDVKDLRRPDASALVNNEKRRSADNSTGCPAHSEVNYPAPDPEMWAALDYGKKLNPILADFYDRVYKDAKLAPFFANSTKQRSIEKQYTFLRRLFSGDKVYLGDRPRNAHHWMVISTELFDYRESIMTSCLKLHGLPEILIERWVRMENSFRPDIIKEKPWNKVIDGVELPVDGYEETILDSGSLCDSCHQAINAGTLVRYHIRLGLIYCPSCMEVVQAHV
jgi:ferredoxin-NADP reductase/truncated hemoglobin YjbI/ferredoxin